MLIIIWNHIAMFSWVARAVATSHNLYCAICGNLWTPSFPCWFAVISLTADITTSQNVKGWVCKFWFWMKNMYANQWLLGNQHCNTDISRFAFVVLSQVMIKWSKKTFWNSRLGIVFFEPGPQNSTFGDESQVLQWHHKEYKSYPATTPIPSIRYSDPGLGFDLTKIRKTWTVNQQKNKKWWNLEKPWWTK